MKRITILTVCFFAFLGFAKADDDRPISVNELPQKSVTFIRQHFPNQEISFAKLEKDFLEKKYEVVFVNGEKIEFDKNGEWKEINCQYSVVPDTLVPQAIRNQITKQYPQAKMLKIERDAQGYEVKLNNRLELTFNKTFQLIDIDD